MKKLYIPTTTLNFNNLLSCESISPSEFYRERSYGYRFWYNLPTCNAEGYIILYEKPFRFSLPATGLEHHPMLLELQVDERLLSRIGDGIWGCDHTLYLSPWRSRFILFSEQDKTVMLSMSNGSLETKMTDLYRRGCIEVKTDITSSEIEPQHLVQSEINRECLEKDTIVNKLKGLVYGYYIGALLSLPPELVEEYNHLRELRNILSSMVSSPSKKPSQYQERRIGAIFAGKSNGEEHAQLFCSQPDNAFSMLKGWETELYKQIQKATQPLEVKEKELIIRNGEVQTIKAAGDYETLVKKWIDEVLCDKAYDGKIGTFNAELATTLTLKAKEFYGDKWEGSEVRSRLNRMRRFIAGQDQMDSWDSGAVSSMAAVLLKGEDWARLLDFLRGEGVCDCRLAFAFYGMLHGFANLTRDFTDIIFSQSEDYVSEFIKEVNLQLLGDDLGVVVPKVLYYPHDYDTFVAIVGIVLGKKRVYNALKEHSYKYGDGLPLEDFRKEILDVVDGKRPILKCFTVSNLPISPKKANEYRVKIESCIDLLPLRDNREALKGRLGEIMEADKSKEILKLLYNEDEEPNLFNQQP